MEPNNTTLPFAPPPAGKLPWDGWLLVACAAPGLPANAVTIWLTGRRLRCRGLAIFVFSLAASDFLFLANSGLQIWTVAQGDLWTLGTPLCRLHNLLYSVGYHSGLFLLATISLDRCLLVRAPLWYRCRRPAALPAALCAGSWLAACACSVPNVLLAAAVELAPGVTACLSERGGWEAPLRWLEVLLEGVLPFGLVAACHGAVLARTLRRRPPAPPARFHCVVAATLSAYVLLNLPFQLVQLAQLVAPGRGGHLLYFTGLAFNLNSCLNPFLYLLLGADAGACLLRGTRAALARLQRAVPAHAPPAALAPVPPAVLAQVPPAVLTHVPPAVPAHVPPAVLAQVPPAVLTHVPPAVPAHVPPAVLAQVPPAVPAHVPPAVLAQVPPAVPAHVPPAVPAHVPPAVPTQVPPAVPAHVPPAVPGHVPPAVPAHVPPAVPAHAPHTVPNKVPPAAPTQGPPVSFTNVPSAVPPCLPAPEPTGRPAAPP
ncbi:LOW QUALITY PROTEIN: probable G-protein coupled receptor 152 [Apteryx mantelli]|uniref:LOW QUALITY PROTEIN: probable G-protein coupled receptor 152 n=1 Tax=Apteryx mantelli TaxID=2696672 RepID=A0ABM4EF57_9AVES